MDNRGAVRKPEKRPNSNLGDVRVQLPPAPLRTTCVGWASACPTACKAASPKGYAGSTPARRTRYGPFVYRCRTLAPQAGKAGSIPARAAEKHDQVAQTGRRATLRTSCRKAWEFDSPLGHSLQARQVPNWLSYGRCARFDTGACNCGWTQVQPGLISPDCRVQLPDPPPTGYANGKSGEVESLVTLQVQLLSRSL